MTLFFYLLHGCVCACLYFDFAVHIHTKHLFSHSLSHVHFTLHSLFLSPHPIELWLIHPSFCSSSPTKRPRIILYITYMYKHTRTFLFIIVAFENLLLSPLSSILIIIVFSWIAFIVSLSRRHPLPITLFTSSLSLFLFLPHRSYMWTDTIL